MRKIIVCCILLVLFGCNQPKYDDVYGVRYNLNDEISVTIKMEYMKDKVYSVIVRRTLYDYDTNLESMKVGSALQSNKKEASVIYDCLTNDGSYIEYILLNWDRKEFNFKDNQLLIDYLGLTEELKDKKLTLDELKNSATFIGAQCIDEGVYTNNISFLGLDEYDVVE